MAPPNAKLWDAISDRIYARGTGQRPAPLPEPEEADPLDDPTSPQSQAARRVFGATRAGQLVANKLGSAWDSVPGRALPVGNALSNLLTSDEHMKPPPMPKPAPVGRAALLKMTPVGEKLKAQGIDIDTLTDDDLNAALKYDEQNKPPPVKPAAPLSEQDNPASAASQLERDRLAATPTGGAALADLDRPAKGKLYDPNEEPTPSLPSASLSANAVQDFEKRLKAGGAASAPKAKGPSMDLRKEFDALPEVKAFKDVTISYDKVKRAAGNPSAAGDLSLIFAYMKMLDPGSSVREGEFANAQNAAGIPGRIQAAYNNAISGQRLSSEQRGDFIGQAKNLYDAHLSQYTGVANRYRMLAGKAGADPDEVVSLPGEVGAAPATSPSARAGPTAPPAAGGFDTANGSSGTVRVRRKSDGLVKSLPAEQARRILAGQGYEEVK